MITPELTKWLRENSSGDYRPAAEAADLIDRLVEVMRGAVACSEHQKDCICAWCEVERQNVEIRAATEPLKADCSSAPCSRLFRVQVTFDTVIYAADEKAAKQVVKYGTGEIDDMPVLVIAMPIESRDGLPVGWDTGCLPWGDAPENTTIGEILSANAQAMASADEKTPPKETTL